MLSQRDNDTLCQVGPGTPMGELFRRFWLPALLSSELPEPDCAPVRLKLLGENLVAFRDSEGRVGRRRQLLPAPPREPVLRAERGGRAAVRVPRVEVRRDTGTASTCRRSRRRATSRTR